MKRKIICLILILAFAVACLSGCIFEIDEERDMNQIVATVTYKGNTAVVKKIDVYELYAQQGKEWQEYYGWSEEIFEYLLESLTNRKLLVLDAVDRGLCEWDEDTHSIVIYEKDQDGKIIGPAKGLTYADINEAQDMVNEQYKAVYEALLEEVKEEYAKGEEDEDDSQDTDTDEEEDEDTRTIRPLPVVEEDEEEKEYTTDKFDVDSWFKTFEYTTNEERIAINRVKTMLEKQYRSTTDDTQALQAQIEMVVIKNLEKSLYGEEDLLVTDVDVVNKYVENLTANKEAIQKDDTAYVTAITNNQVFFYHPEAGYGTVKHILLSFEEADDEFSHVDFNGDWSFKDYEDQKSQDYSEDRNKAFRAKLAENLVVNYYGDFMAWFDSEEGYKALTDEDKEKLVDWRDGKTAVEEKLSYNTFFNKVVDEINAQSTIGDKLTKFENFIFGYSFAGDSGMFNNDVDYKVKGEDESSYMGEFTAICQKLMMDKDSEDYSENVDYGVYTAGEIGKVGAMGWCITDYGVHLVIVTNLYQDINVDKDVSDVTVDDLKEIVLDNNNPDVTLYSYLKDSLVSNKKTNIINNYEVNFIQNVKDEAVVIDNSVISRTFA